MHNYEILIYWSNEDSTLYGWSTRASGMCGPRQHAGGGAGTDQPGRGSVARNGAGVRRPDSGAERRTPDAGMTGITSSLICWVGRLVHQRAW